MVIAFHKLKQSFLLIRQYFFEGNSFLINSIKPINIVQAEVTLPEASKKAIEIVAEKFGRIDGLVNNAGVNDGVDLEHGNYERFVQSLHKNLIHYYLLAHECLPYLKTAQGAVVNIGSKTADTGKEQLLLTLQPMVAVTH